jgi:hypothetical protein
MEQNLSPWKLIGALQKLKTPRDPHNHDGEWCFCRCVNRAHDHTFPNHRPECIEATKAIEQAYK